MFSYFREDCGGGNGNISAVLRASAMTLLNVLPEEPGYPTLKEFWKSVQWFSSLSRTCKHTKIRTRGFIRL
jgi:hypothetical protein